MRLNLINDWLDEQDDNTKRQIAAALALLKEKGPHLGRPLVDTIQGSFYRNMKELRPGSSGSSEIRILFIFDPQRKAVMLFAGDKQHDWDRWYSYAIPEAEHRYEQYVRQLERSGQ